MNSAPLRMPIGVSDFRKLCNPEEHYVFVDKSLLIKEIIDDGSEVMLITRPRRWGKTLNMSMLEHFFAPQVSGVSTQLLFDDLAIARVDNGNYLRYQGQNPVIFISFKDIKHSTLSLAIKEMRSLVRILFRKYQTDLLGSDRLNEFDRQLFIEYITPQVDGADLKNSLLILSELLSKHYSKKSVYILIDEYDTPLNYAYTHGYWEEMTEFMKNMLSATFKGNPHLKKGVMTGIMRISKNSMLSGLNNVEVYTVLNNAYSQHFGFSEAEVNNLFAVAGMAQAVDVSAVRRYYNGYRVGDHTVYNPWSIMECLHHEGKLEPYWVSTADDQLLQNTLWSASVEIKKKLEVLLSDEVDYIDVLISETVRFDDMAKDETALWSVLLSTGYLTFTEHDTDQFDIYESCRLRIPNEEVKRLYVGIFRNWLRQQLNMSAHQAFVADLVSGRIEVFTEKLEQYLQTYGSYHDFPQESNYHTFMLGLLCSMTPHYYLHSNTEAGYGRADMILVPREGQGSDAIILEFKRDRSCEVSIEQAMAAVEQIDDRQYRTFINRYSHVKRILKISLVFNGKKVATSYAWENYF